MTACILDDPAYCFCPIAETDDEPPQIRILVEGFAFAIPMRVRTGAAGCCSAPPGGVAVCRRQHAVNVEQASKRAMRRPTPLRRLPGARAARPLVSPIGKSAVREAAREFSDGHVPEGFLCFPVQVKALKFKKPILFS